MVLSIKKWRGKTVVITGASSGIGDNIVEKLVEHGLIVVGLARRVEIVREKAKKLRGKPGVLYAFECDLTKTYEIIEVFQKIQDQFGAIHILINNAGYAVNTSLIDGDIDAWKKTLDTNVLGLSIATREAIKNMQKYNVDGHILHMNSILGHSIPSYFTFNMYAASKFAVTALTETLRIELKEIDSKIKITTISPGLVNTEMISNYKAGELVGAPILEPEDVTDAVIYALSTPAHVQIHDISMRPVGGF